jgi:hypothetical protein
VFGVLERVWELNDPPVLSTRSKPSCSCLASVSRIRRPGGSADSPLADGKQWPADVYGACPAGATWPYILVSILPGFIRFIQCLKRYHDSRLDIHLINVSSRATRTGVRGG